jgi:Arc/MetJ-type ribon-helix-helix transcriptional regulator
MADRPSVKSADRRMPVTVWLDEAQLADLELLVNYRHGPHSRSAVVRRAVERLFGKEAAWLIRARRAEQLRRQAEAELPFIAAVQLLRITATAARTAAATLGTSAIPQEPISHRRCELGASRVSSTPSQLRATTAKKPSATGALSALVVSHRARCASVNVSLILQAVSTKKIRPVPVSAITGTAALPARRIVGCRRVRSKVM